MATPDPNNAGPHTNPNDPPPPPITPAPQQMFIHIPNNPVPKFDGSSDSFPVWKACMLLHIAGVDRYLMKILKEGPYIPLALNSVILNPDGSQRAPIAKHEDQWTSEERRLVELDTKLQNMIISSIPPIHVPTLVLLPNAKSMWDELVLQFEGTAETIVTRKVALNKKYESFFALPNESLTDTYIRFTQVVNQLRALGIEKDKEILLEKFCDILPSKWTTLIMILRQSKTLHSHTLNSLYGVCRFTEENSTERVVAEQDALNHSTKASSSTGSVQSTELHGSALVSSESETNSMKKMMSNLMESSLVDANQTDCDETDNDDLMAMIAKTFGRFKTRSSQSSQRFAKPSSTIDKTNLTCFKCGKKGHFMKECKVNQSSQPGPSSSNSFQKPVDPYKLKYKQLKAHIAMLNLDNQEKSGCKLAADKKQIWEDSDDSSDDDEEVKELAFMAIGEEPGHLVNGDVTNGRWVEITLKKVSNFNSTNHEEKLDFLDLLNCDLIYVESVLSEKSKSLDSVSTELEYYKNNSANLQDIHLKLKSQETAYADLVKENEQLSKTIEHEKTIIESWVKASKISYKCASDQIPHQMRAIIGGDLSTAAAIPEIYELDPLFRPKTSFDKPLTESFVKTGTETEPILSVPMTLSTKSSPQPSSSNSKGSKKKVIQTDAKNIKTDVIQSCTETNRISRLESQVTLLARQVQSCNTRVNTLQSLSSKPNLKPFSKVSKPLVQTDKKIGLQKKAPIFVPETKAKSVGKSISQPIPVVSHEKSTEPISRWVPKNN